MNHVHSFVLTYGHRWRWWPPRILRVFYLRCWECDLKIEEPT